MARTKLRSGRGRGKCFPMNSQSAMCFRCKKTTTKAQTYAESVEYHPIKSIHPYKELEVFGRRAVVRRVCKENCK